MVNQPARCLMWCMYNAHSVEALIVTTNRIHLRVKPKKTMHNNKYPAARACQNQRAEHGVNNSR